MYGSNGNNTTNRGALVTINQTNGIGTVVGTPVANVGLPGLAFHPDGRLFAVTLTNLTPSTLIQVNPDTGALITSIGAITDNGTPISIGDLSFQPGTGGRADLLATGGDIPAGHAYVGTACWDAQEQEGFKALRDCVKGTDGKPGSCTVLFKEGQILNCAADFRNTEMDPPAENPNDSTQEPGAPSETPDEAPSDVTADF